MFSFEKCSKILASEATKERLPINIAGTKVLSCVYLFNFFFFSSLFFFFTSNRFSYLTIADDITTSSFPVPPPVKHIGTPFLKLTRY